MKTTITKLWLIATMLCLPGTIMANIQHTVTFSADELTITNDTIDGLEFSRVNYGDLLNGGDPGEPSLPVKYLTFSVPYDAYNITVNATCSNAQENSVPLIVIPEQEPQEISAPKNPFTDPDMGIYDIDEYFPANIATISNEGFLDGDNHLITVAIQPAQYNPVKSLVRLYRTVNITISYNSGNGIEQMAIKPVLKYVDNNRLQTLQRVKDMVANPTSVETFRGPLAINTFEVEPLEMFQYCVITSRELAPAFKRLIELKKHKGFDAGIVCMEDILACSEYQDGDVVSGINDDAGKLRAYLTDAYRYGTRYVLLGGKEPHVPIRYGRTSNSKKADWVEKNDFVVPTDLYFSEVNSNWDYDEDQRFGEAKEDLIDYSSELYVGRILCKNQDEVKNYIDKLIRYELNPGNGDFSYLRKAYYAQADGMQKNGEADSVAANLINVFPEYRISNYDESIHTTNNEHFLGSDIISELNTENVAFMSFHGHGSPGGITLGKYRTPDKLHQSGINALDSESWYLYNEDNNGFDCLNNKDYPAICYSISCLNMPFDIYIDNVKNVTYSVTQNLGESFTIGGDYGGVAYLGNTRIGYYDYWFYSTGMVRSAYLELAFIKLLNAGNTIIGQCEAESKAIYNSPKLDCGHHIRLTHNLLGDPSIDMWTDIPQVLTEADVHIDRSSPNSLSVSCQYLNGCTVVACSTNGVCVPKTATSNNVSFSNVSPNSHIVIYRHNMLPYLAPIQIQNETINNSLYYFANMANIGTFAYPDRESGNVVLDSNADVVIEALGDVVLGPGLVMNAGASLSVNTPGKVTIDGCIINNGATLKIEALETEITDDFNAQQGAVIEISNLSN